MSSEKFDLARTNWLNLLPSLKGKAVFVYASGMHHWMEALKRCGCRSITCYDEENQLLDQKSIKTVKNEETVEKNAYDICILNVPETSHKNGTTLKNRIELSFKILNSGGILLLGFPNSWFVKKNKVMVKKMLQSSGFFHHNCSLCIPSFDLPLSILPFSLDTINQKTVFQSLAKDCFRIRSIKTSVKDLIKYVFIKTQGVINPSMGLLFIATKNKNTVVQNELDHFFSSVAGKFSYLDIGRPHYTEWRSKSFVGKKVGMIYEVNNQHRMPRLVAKRLNYQYHTFDIKREYKVLTLLNQHNSFFLEKRIMLPDSVYCQDNGSGRVLTIESAVPGQSLHENFSRRKKDFRNKEKIINGFVERQEMIQQYLSENLLDNFPETPITFYENRLELKWEPFSDLSRLEKYKKIVQHGDYTVLNLYYDKTEDTFGIIDWDGASSGLPPIFDLFRFFLSIGFSQNSDDHSFFEDYFTAFVRVYFEYNPFSEFVKKTIVAQCIRVGFEKDKIFQYFLDFLLFLYNQYRLLYPPNEFINLYRRMLEYSLEHQKEFILIGE